MNKDVVERAILTLAEYLKIQSHKELERFDKEITKVCDHDNKNCVLIDLNTLADVLRENKCEYLVDRIFFYDDEATQKLNEMLER